jgi:hypothetical protein
VTNEKEKKKKRGGGKGGNGGKDEAQYLKMVGRNEPFEKCNRPKRNPFRTLAEAFDIGCQGMI